MKKIILILLLLFCATGCIKRDSLEDISVCTTIYPIKYITEQLYGQNSKIISIYPNGKDISNYELTDKQIKDYSKSGLAIFNGIGKEKDYVIHMYQNNKDIKIIDATLSLEYNNSYEEMWLDPANYLMMLQNIKDGFKQYITNHYLKKEIDENYEKLKLEISSIDANFKLMSKNATDNNIVVTKDLFKFLEKYDLNIYSLEENENLTDKNLQKVNDLIKNKTVQYIFAVKDEELSDTVKKLQKDTNIEIVYLHTLSNLSTDEINKNETYSTIMNNNLNLLKQEVYE